MTRTFTETAAFHRGYQEALVPFPVGTVVRVVAYGPTTGARLLDVGRQGTVVGHTYRRVRVTLDPAPSDGEPQGSTRTITPAAILPATR